MGKWGIGGLNVSEMILPIQNNLCIFGFYAHFHQKMQNFHILDTLKNHSQSILYKPLPWLALRGLRTLRVRLRRPSGVLHYKLF